MITGGGARLWVHEVVVQEVYADQCGDHETQHRCGDRSARSRHHWGHRDLPIWRAESAGSGVPARCRQPSQAMAAARQPRPTGPGGGVWITAIADAPSRNVSPHGALAVRDGGRDDRDQPGHGPGCADQVVDHHVVPQSLNRAGRGRPLLVGHAVGVADQDRGGGALDGLGRAVGQHVGQDRPPADRRRPTGQVPDQQGEDDADQAYAEQGAEVDHQPRRDLVVEAGVDVLRRVGVEQQQDAPAEWDGDHEHQDRPAEPRPPSDRRRVVARRFSAADIAHHRPETPAISSRFSAVSRRPRMGHQDGAIFRGQDALLLLTRYSWTTTGELVTVKAARVPQAPLCAEWARAAGQVLPVQRRR